MLDHHADAAPTTAPPAGPPTLGPASEAPPAGSWDAGPGDAGSRLAGLPPSPAPAWRRTLVGGVEFDQVSCLHVVEHVRTELAAGRGGVVLCLDASRRGAGLHLDDGVLGARRPGSTLVVPDLPASGWARLRQRTPRHLDGVPAMPLLWALARSAAADRRRVMVVGGPPGGARDVSGILEATVPDLDDVGVHQLAAAVDEDPGVNADLLVAVGAHRPDLVLVSPDVPRQVAAVLRLGDILPGAWIVGCGAGAAFGALTQHRHTRRA